MEDSTPILIGAGQFTEKDVPPQQAHPPMGIAAEAAKAALADTGIGDTLAALIDTLAVVRIFPDSTNRRRAPNPFGRADNPPRAVARRIGANPTNAIYGNIGGETPQKFINEMAERIVSADVEIVLLTGSEAIKTASTARRNGIDMDWNEEDQGSLDDRGIGIALPTPQEMAHGIGLPIQTYPLFENAIRGQLGHSVEEHMLAMGNLFSSFTQVAAKNPFSFYGVERSAEELATVTAENRWIGFPYPKWMNAMEAVNQGAAVVMTSVGKARELGVDPRKWVFLHGCGEAKDKPLFTERVNYHTSPGIAVNSAKSFAMADKTIADMDYIDIYSCFPSAVEIACDALDLNYDDPRGLTLTGGLPYFGGPGSNYSMHAIASLMPLLRDQAGSFGLITANGGCISKHASGIYSTTPTEGHWQRENPSSYQHEVDDMHSPDVDETPQGKAAVETYTVICNRGIPERGIVIGRLEESGARFVSNTLNDSATLQSMLEEEYLGRLGTVSTADGLNTFIAA